MSEVPSCVLDVLRNVFSEYEQRSQLLLEADLAASLRWGDHRIRPTIAKARQAGYLLAKSVARAPQPSPSPSPGEDPTDFPKHLVFFATDKLFDGGDGDLEDGPSETSQQFRWKGKAYLVSKRNWQLLRVLWQQNRGVSYFTLAKEVWGEEKPTGTLTGQISRLTTELANLGLPITVKTRSERAYLDIEPSAN